MLFTVTAVFSDFTKAIEQYEVETPALVVAATDSPPEGGHYVYSPPEGGHYVYSPPGGGHYVYSPPEGGHV